MYRSLFIMSLLLWLAACNNGTDKAANANGNDKPGVDLKNDLVQLSGEFAGNWPSADNGVTLVSLTLNTDSSFAYTEREPLAINKTQPAKLERKAAIKHSGTYSLNANSGIMKLYFLDASMGTQMFKLDADSLVKLDAEMKPLNNATFKLSRASRVVSSIQNYLVSYQTAPFERFPVQVFLRAAGNNVKLHKTYLDQAPESERALVAYYCAKYNTGCDEKGCTLPLALGMDDAAQKAAIEKWLPNAPSAKAVIADSKKPVERERLSMVYFIKTPKGIHVNYTVLDARDANLVGKDDFELEGNEWKLVKEIKPELLGNKKK
jgi:hypothetical protein